MRKIILFAFAFSISSLAFSQTNNSQKAEKNNNAKYCSTCPKSEITENSIRINSQLPADFPKYINTGNKKLDDTNYDNAKQGWINNNPQRYKASVNKKRTSEEIEKEKKQAGINKNLN